MFATETGGLTLPIRLVGRRRGRSRQACAARTAAGCVVRTV